jgi:hypothetical protein
MQARPAVAAALLALSGCGAHVSVTPSGSGTSAPAKPPGCSLPFFRVPPLDQPYDEMATLHYTTRAYQAGDPADAQEAIRQKACALGADAVLVTREFAPGVAGGKGSPPTMTGTAIKFRAPRPTPAPEDRAKAPKPGATR